MLGQQLAVMRAAGQVQQSVQAAGTRLAAGVRAAGQAHPWVDRVAQVDDLHRVGWRCAGQVAALDELDELAHEAKGVLQHHLPCQGW